MSLDWTKVSLKGMFANGQAYVALSRCRSLDGLQVLDYAGDGEEGGAERLLRPSAPC
jgi:hypothetical protein